MGKSSKKKFGKRGGQNGERIGDGDEILRVNLGYEQLAIKDVESFDGNSFFRAVSDQVLGSQNGFIEVKARVLEFIQLNKELIVEKNPKVTRNLNDLKEREEIKAVCFVYEKNLRVYNAKEEDIFETYPSDSWIYLSKHEDGTFATVRYINDFGDTIPNHYSWFYETDRVHEERKEKMKMLSEYFVQTYNITSANKLTWILMKLFLYDATYTEIDDSYEKILFLLEKYNH